MEQEVNANKTLQHDEDAEYSPAAQHLASKDWDRQENDPHSQPGPQQTFRKQDQFELRAELLKIMQGLIKEPRKTDSPLAIIGLIQVAVQLVFCLLSASAGVSAHVDVHLSIFHPILAFIRDHVKVWAAQVSSKPKSGNPANNKSSTAPLEAPTRGEQKKKTKHKRPKSPSSKDPVSSTVTSESVDAQSINQDRVVVVPAAGTTGNPNPFRLAGELFDSTIILMTIVESQNSQIEALVFQDQSWETLQRHLQDVRTELTENQRIHEQQERTLKDYIMQLKALVGRSKLELIEDSEAELRPMELLVTDLKLVIEDLQSQRTS